MTALPTDLREAVETVRAGIKERVPSGWAPTYLRPLVLIEQRLMEYERLLKRLDEPHEDQDWEVVKASVLSEIRALDSPKEKP